MYNKAAIFGLAIILSGCASAINPTKLEPPAARLMAPSPKLHEPKEGDDLVRVHAELRRVYSTETDRLKRLQRYVRTITTR